MPPFGEEGTAGQREARRGAPLAALLVAWCLQLVACTASVLVTFVTLASVGPGYVSGSHDLWFVGWVSTAGVAALSLAGSLAVGLLRRRAGRSAWWAPLLGAAATVIVAGAWWVAAI